MKRVVAILPFCLLGTSLFSQSLNQSDSTLFDFWIGQWNLTWRNEDGTEGRGTNNVVRILDAKVIQENFVDMKGFKGSSMSVLTARTNTWKQAWADNQGGYFDFEGFVEGDKRGFRTQPKEVNEKVYVFRMIFYDIRKESFIWDWEGSTDSGKTWNLIWRINYKRI
jgi:hypothetical protein